MGVKTVLSSHANEKNIDNCMVIVITPSVSKEMSASSQKQTLKTKSKD
jgi:hypothetical protein